MPIERRISPLRDLWALLCLMRHFKRHRFDVVHSVTPKAGLLSMAAAWLVRVPVRIHTFTGQVWATRRGAMRIILRAMDQLIAGCATHVLVDGRSQREFLIENGVVSAAKSTVLANTSHCSVDPKRFRPDRAARGRVRTALGVPEDAVLFLYLGRLSRDKGVLDLAAAFVPLAARNLSACLLVVGPDEDGLQRPMEELLSRFAQRVHWVGYTLNPEAYMAAADVLCLPSYREGFGQVLIEASAAGIPVIATRIYGVIDAVVEGETGLLYPPGDVATLREHMEALASAPGLRQRFGDAGRVRALRDFAQERVTSALIEYYSLLTPNS
jgi:glycosyltransferase involved in cell wall biosynthesis